MTDLVRTPAGRIAVTSRALTRLVVRAAERVDGARVRRPRRGLTIEVADGRAQVALELAVRRGSVIPEVAGAVQQSVGETLGTMLEVDVSSVEVSVEEVFE